MSEITLRVERRDTTGKNANRQLRAAGLVPAVVYGGGRETVAIQVERHKLLKLLRESGGENVVFLLQLGDTGKGRHTMIRELDVHPVSREVRHIDFLRVVMTEKVRVQVPIELVGEAEGVKNEGGILDFVSREVTVECLPSDIPQTIDLDVSEMRIGDHIEVGVLELPDAVTLIDEPEKVLVSLAHARVVEEEVEAEEEEELLEAEMEEPEVIGKGKGAEEESAEGEEEAD